MFCAAYKIYEYKTIIYFIFYAVSIRCLLLWILRSLFFVTTYSKKIFVSRMRAGTQNVDFLWTQEQLCVKIKFMGIPCVLSIDPNNVECTSVYTSKEAFIDILRGH